MIAGAGQRLFLTPYPSTMASPRISLRFLKKPRDTRAKECLILRKPVMVSMSPRLCCSSGSRLSGTGEDRAGAGLGRCMAGRGSGGEGADGRGSREGALRTGTKGDRKQGFIWVTVRGMARGRGVPRGRY